MHEGSKLYPNDGCINDENYIIEIGILKCKEFHKKKTYEYFF